MDVAPGRQNARTVTHQVTARSRRNVLAAKGTKEALHLIAVIFECLLQGHTVLQCAIDSLCHLFRRLSAAGHCAEHGSRIGLAENGFLNKLTGMPVNRFTSLQRQRLSLAGAGRQRCIIAIGSILADCLHDNRRQRFFIAANLQVLRNGGDLGFKLRRFAKDVQRV